MQSLILEAHAEGLLTAVHDCADGGLAVALAEMCIASGTGLEAPAVDLGERLDAALFGEAQSRFIVAVRDAGAASRVASLGRVADVPVVTLGLVQGQQFNLGGVVAELDDLSAAYRTGLERALAG